MPRSTRKILIASLAALHVWVMLCGACLHGLPGWGHGVGLRGDGGVVAVHELGRGTHSSADHCQVCHLLSIGQLPVGEIRIGSTRIAREPTPPCRTETPLPPPRRSAPPRAPPPAIERPI
jgi:hypothetical protein